MLRRTREEKKRRPGSERYSPCVLRANEATVHVIVGELGYRSYARNEKIQPGDETRVVPHEKLVTAARGTRCVTRAFIPRVAENESERETRGGGSGGKPSYVMTGTTVDRD